VFECVINIAEGSDDEHLRSLTNAAGASLRDRHSDAIHNRSVFTLINDAESLATDVRALVACAFDRLTLATHTGVHPRFGVVDVVPFVALSDEGTETAQRLRDATATWIAATYEVPCFFYGPSADGLRTLPEVRRRAFVDLAPDVGPMQAHPRYGASALGNRPILLAWNMWLEGTPLDETRRLAASVRQHFTAVRTLGFDLGGEYTQVSCNIIDVTATGPDEVYDFVVERLSHGRVVRCELVGLAPQSVLDRTPTERWLTLGLSRDATIEARR
jgi:glutamate formiminotransferase